MPNLMKFGVRTCYYLPWRNLPVVSALTRTQIPRRFFSKHVKHDTVKVKKVQEKSINNKVSGKFILPLLTKCPEVPNAPCPPDTDRLQKLPVDRTKVLQSEKLNAGRSISLTAQDRKEKTQVKSSQESQGQVSGGEKPPQAPQEGGNRLYWLLLAVILLAGGAAVLQNYNVFESKGPAKVIDDEETKKKRRVPVTAAEIPKEVPYLLIGDD